MMKKTAFAFSLLLIACGASRQPADSRTGQTSRAQAANESTQNRRDEKTDVTDAARRCLGNAASKGNVEALADQQPGYYLKGDFDGDQIPDDAVAVKGVRTRRNGVLICTGKGLVSILGADNPTNPPFSDMPDDNFVAPKWKVYTKGEAESIHNVDNPGVQVAAPKGDSIAMIWEDGICLIYWDGRTFKWGCGQ